MKKEIIQYAFGGILAGIVLCLVTKKIRETNKRAAEKESEEKFAFEQRRRFSDLYGEYTL
jgi:hypothetical protein